MRFRAAAALGCFALCAIAPVRAAASSNSDDAVYIDGVGGAHGYGLAMDGVEGEADHGWDHDKILNLFYPGTSSGRMAGTIRVWLAEGGPQAFTLPGGGAVLDGPGGRTLAVLPSGGRVTVSERGGALRIAASGTQAPSHVVADSAQSTPAPQPQLTPGATPAPPTPLATIVPTPQPITKKPVPTKTPTPTLAPKPTATPALTARGSIYIVPSGVPALTTVGTTGHNYRGTIEIRRVSPGTVRVINHVDLETYVDGIAEEKGAGWPPEAMDVLAVAARSLAVSTMTWYSTHHGDGYDICPTDKCQVYLGYDGEDYPMRAAAAQTAGIIRTYNGSPILAMYHGNGGGQTETYGPEYPYLKSVKYPYADPSHWHVQTSFSQIVGQLKAKKDPVPDPLELLKVLKRGDSPRVQSLELAGGQNTSETMAGTDFADALSLPSTWFYFSGKAPAHGVGVSSATVSAPVFGSFGSEVTRGDVPRGGSLWAIVWIALVTFVVVTSATYVIREPLVLTRLRTLDLRLFGLRPFGRLGGDHSSR